MWFIFILSNFIYAQDFKQEAKALVTDLKTHLVKNLTDKIQNEGVEKAIPFCHENVKPIAKSAAGERVNKFVFGRTSHKIRNSENSAQEFLQKYLAKYQSTMMDAANLPKEIEGVAKDGKKFYAEPLYVGPQCLVCHGESIQPNVQKAITQLYPQDQATGFKLKEFRGFIWVKEK